jgi:hypothetical protein
MWVEKGTVQLATHSNAAGTGTANVGTNATLDIQYSGWASPGAFNLYGTGTNAAMGALRKTTAGAITIRGITTVGADSRVVVTGGGITFITNIASGANTLYVTNTTTVQMTGGEMSGSKTTGDGALHKSGSSVLLIRPASGLTGSINLQQGEIRQGAGSSLPAGGTLTMTGGTTYSSDGSTTRTLNKNMVINGGVRWRRTARAG